MKKGFLHWIIPALILIAITLACKISAGGPEPPEQNSIFSTDAPGTLKTAVDQTVEQSKSAERVALTITQDQATSYIALELAKDPDSLIKDPKVFFLNDQVEIFGLLNQGVFSANIRLVLMGEINSDGNLNIRIKSIDLGPLPVSESITGTVSTLVDQTINGPLTQFATGYKIDSLIISNGLMTVTGLRR